MSDTKIIIPFYVKELNNKTENNLKLLLTCLGSYFYHENVYDIEIVTNHKYIAQMVENFEVSVVVEEDSFFSTIGDGIGDKLENLQTSVKLSTIYNYSIKYPDKNFILMDLDMLFMGKINIDNYIDQNKYFTMFVDVVDGCKKSINEMVEDSSIFNDNKSEWINSGFFIFN